MPYKKCTCSLYIGVWMYFSSEEGKADREDGQIHCNIGLLSANFPQSLRFFFLHLSLGGETLCQYQMHTLRMNVCKNCNCYSGEILNDGLRHQRSQSAWE